ncbi:OB-fold nucleic acid binding domain-containing protein [Hwanghaeella sp.]|uniref:OB-fold nucleic acid binding domain-containing protein n=1 Tax=Hwanghaeella sp. TaxID=2605943 RepID=UPI003CCC0DB5
MRGRIEGMFAVPVGHAVAAGLLVAILGLADLEGAAAEDSMTGSPGPKTLHVSDAKMLPDGALSLRDGQEIVLTGLDVGLGLAPASKAFIRELQALQNAGPWRLIAAEKDRYDRLAGRFETSDGVWVQERLLRLGFARYGGGVSSADERALLLAAEQAARAAWRGVWRNPRYRVRPADIPDDIYNGFQIVEGRIVTVGRSNGTVFLNFGEDWRTDFTAGVSLRLRQKEMPLTADGAPISVYDLEGQLVRLRGVVRRYNGPYMEIAAADQIELLDEQQADPVSFRSSSPSDRRRASESTL